MGEVVRLLIDLASLGGLYAFLAAGYVVAYRTSGVVNFAYPACVLVGAYLTASLYELTDSWPLALAAGLGLGALAGLGFYLGLLRPLTGQPRTSAVMMTVGLLFLIEALARLNWRGATVFMPLPGAGTGWTVSGQLVRAHDLALAAAPVGLALLLTLFYRLTRLGISMRAVAENPVLAARRGVDIELALGLSWVVATAVAVLAGVLAGAKGPVNPGLVQVSIKAFAVALVGGLDSVAGLVPGALVVAGAEVLAVRYLGPHLAEAVPFAVLLGVLTLRPWGLCGSREEIYRV